MNCSVTLHSRTRVANVRCWVTDALLSVFYYYPWVGYKIWQNTQMLLILACSIPLCIIHQYLTASSSIM